MVAAVLANYDYTEAAQSIRAPTLVIHGERDYVASVAGARRWARAIPQSRLLVLPNAGHLSYIEESTRMRQALDVVLRGEWPDGAIAQRSSQTTP